MICHCRVLTLVDGEEFWLRRTLNSRFILGEHREPLTEKGPLFDSFGGVWSARDE